MLIFCEIQEKISCSVVIFDTEGKPQFIHVLFMHPLVKSLCTIPKLNTKDLACNAANNFNRAPWGVPPFHTPLAPVHPEDGNLKFNGSVLYSC